MARHAIRLADPEYPTLLREAGGPEVLYVEGDVGLLSERAVAVVGTRACTGYGAAVARHLAGGLARGGVTVVSGLARGIDAEAHAATLGVGRTVAVLAHGLDTTSPPSNLWLRRRIVAEGGAVVSGWPDGERAIPPRFLARNAWISGLSSATVVVEAPVRSGALRTARCALDQGRDVWAVPGRVGSPASAGCNALLASGAYVVADVDEAVAALTGRPTARHDEWLSAVFAGDDLSEVARRHGRTLTELLGDLGRREARGEVVRLPGQRYAPGGSAG